MRRWYCESNVGPIAGGGRTSPTVGSPSVAAVGAPPALPGGVSAASTLRGDIPPHGGTPSVLPGTLDRRTWKAKEKPNDQKETRERGPGGSLVLTRLVFERSGDRSSGIKQGVGHTLLGVGHTRGGGRGTRGSGGTGGSWPARSACGHAAARGSRWMRRLDRRTGGSGTKVKRTGGMR